MRDHLFVSYAAEDLAFVEWLSLRLTAQGYKVWSDGIKLLGGESYPRDIDEAIKGRAFRFLAVLSRNSIKKPNPLKERTLALKLASERNENFVIPLNLDGLSTNDLDWMFTDLTFIPFYLCWAEGLARLLKNLEECDAPKGLADGPSVAATWYEAKGLMVREDETLWANVSQIIELPTDILRFESDPGVPSEQRSGVLRQWPHAREGEVLWSFVPPPLRLAKRYDLKERGRIADWRTARSNDVNAQNVAKHVFNESLKSRCLARGMQLTPDRLSCYFPDSLLPNNRLPLRSYDGTQTWVRCAGIRTFRVPAGKEECRYHLAPSTRVWLGHELGSLLQVRVRLFLTSLDGVPLEQKAALRRRKKICRSWWNRHWLLRILASLQYIAGGAATIRIGGAAPQRMVIATRPLLFQAGSRLDESRLGRANVATEDLDEELLDLESNGRDTPEGDAEDE